MSNAHEAIREMLALAAAGALDDTEAQRVQEHAANCTECAAELERWQSLAGALRRVPTPQPSPQLLARVRAQAERRLAEVSEGRRDARVMLLLLLFSWTLVLATRPIVQLLGGETLAWLSAADGRLWVWLSGYTVVGWLAAGVAVMFGMRERRAGRAI